MPGGKKAESQKTDAKKQYSRRDFLVTGGTVVAVDALLAATPKASATPAASTATAAPKYPASKGYLVYDSKKCTSCTTCMLSCSLVHYGVQNLSLSRIQVMQDSFGRFPDDVKMAPCRQCVAPPCVQFCPVGAAFVDQNNGNVRRIDNAKCIGCKTCLRMCPQQPHRTVWNEDLKKSSKCDLCLETPYWNEKGGIGGKQACVETCPMKAIRFVSETPDQTETNGYDVKLRNEHWFRLGFVDEDQPPGTGSSAGLGTAQPKMPTPKKE
jgi:protein NrfC